MGWSILRKQHSPLVPLATLSLILLFMLLFLSPLSSSTLSTAQSTTFTNSGGATVAQNESYAYDQDVNSFAYFPVNTGTVDYWSFNTSGHTDAEAILNVTVSFDLQIINTNNDKWELAYSVDNGTSWTSLRALGSGTLARQTLTYSLVDTGNTPWSWANISDALQVRVQTQVQGGNDGGELDLYELTVNVTTDVDGPNIALLTPADQANLTTPSIIFSYLPNDTQSGIANCSLIINGLVNSTNTSVTRGIAQNLTIMFGDGIYSWNITCYDNSSSFNGNTSPTRQFLLDTTPPTVAAVWPPAGFLFNASPLMAFTYNVTDLSGIANCSLMINDSATTLSINLTNYSVTKGVNVTFTQRFASGSYVWAINCTDAQGFVNGTGQKTLRINYTAYPLTFNGLAVPSPFDLYAGQKRQLNCTVLLQDNNSAANIGTVSASIYHDSLSSSGGANDNQFNYLNASCSCTSVNVNTENCTCSFDVWYVARNGTWQCNVTAQSLDDGIAYWGNRSLTLDPLYALNVSDGIDYGAVSAMDISQNVSALVSNLGNNALAVGVIGYGGAQGDGLSFVCDTGGNVSIGNVHFSAYSAYDFMTKQQLNGSLQQVENLTVARPTSIAAGAANTTYWQAQAPPFSLGDCIGNVVFVAMPG